MVSNGVYSFAIFYYNNITWDAGNASGGDDGICPNEEKGQHCTAALVGFDSGDGVHRYVVEGSCNNSILNITNMSNVFKPGVFVFRIDDANVTQPPTTTQPPMTSPGTQTMLTTTSTAVQTTATMGSMSTTPAPVNPLSNADGTPCNCNDYGVWLDLVLIIDRSMGVGEDGLTDVG